MLDPLVVRLKRLGVPRTPAVAVAVAVAVPVVMVMVTLATLALIALAASFWRTRWPR